MRVRRILATCLAGAVGAAAVPAAVLAPPATAAYAPIPASAPAAPNWSNSTLAQSLQKLRAEVNARWPNRSKASDGWLGDAYHQRSKSDHNPVGFANGPDHGTAGVVHAIDITSRGIDTTAVLNAVIGDARVWYVIYNRTIWSRNYSWKPRPYFGASHTTHIHVSLRADSHSAAVRAERDARPWLAGVASASAMTPSQVKVLQRALIARGYSIPSGATGFLGSQTKAAVAAFQRSQGWRGSGADGIPGSLTLARLGLSSSGPAITFAAVRTTAAPKASASGKYVPGARGSHIKAMQQRLIANGIRIPSGATGLFGNETRAAVAAFQRSQGWRGSGADGIPGAVTLARLGVSSAPAVRTAVVKTTAAPKASASGKYVPGARGSHIKAMQQRLIANGIRIPSGATGLFGNETRAAVAAFQRSQGWRGSGADGIPGAVTLARLGIR